MPFGIAASLIGGALGIGGALISGNAAQDAAKTQIGAANQAAQVQQQEFGQTQKNLLPFLQSGQLSQETLMGLLGFGTGQPFDPSKSGLLANPIAGAQIPTYNMPQFGAQEYQQSPGYSFALQGGTQALQNAGATTTGAMSGNVLKALQGFGTGLANQDYQQNYQNFATNYGNQFTANNSNFWSTANANAKNQSDIFNRLAQLAGSGQNAGASLGALGNTAAGNIGNAYIGAGNAGAAGTIGSANATTGGLNSLATLLQSPNGGNNSLIAQLLAGGGGGSANYYGNGNYGGGGDSAVAL